MNRTNAGGAEVVRKKSNELVAAEDGAVEAAAQQPTYEQICARAYEIHIERGGEHGRDLEDWLQAERELTQGDES
jgi:hypothetical protein